MNFEHPKTRDSPMVDEVRLMSCISGKSHSDKMRMFFITLPKMTATAEECRSALDQWIYTIKNLGHMERMAFTDNRMDPARAGLFKKLGEITSFAALPQKDLENYEQSLKAYRDTMAVFRTAINEGYDQGLDQGLNEGLAKGRAEGEAEGLAKGRAAIIHRMYASVMSADRIASIVGPDIKEIEQILAKD